MIKKTNFPVFNSLYSVFPYRSKTKNIMSAFTHQQLNMKQDPKEYQLKTIGYYGEYIGDIMYSQQAKLAYLVMLEINTRYLFVEQLFDVVFDVDESSEYVNLKKSQKTTLNIIKAIQNIEKKIEKIGGNPIRILRFDGESAIKTLVKANDKQIKTPWGIYKQNFIIIQQSPASHSFTSLIDRAILTIRTLLYNINTDLSNPKAVKHVVDVYNMTRHETLTKYLKHIKPEGVSPMDMIESDILYQYFISELKDYNINIYENEDIELKEGDRVRILSSTLKELNKTYEKIRSKWSKEIFTIKERIGNQYKIKEMNYKYLFSRYLLLKV